MINHCLTCGKEFQVRPAKIRTGKGKYCSKTCYEAIRSKKIIRNCDYCGKEAEKYLNYTRRAKNTFCSQKCKRAWQKARTGSNATRWNGGDVNRICEICGDPFTVPASVVKLGKGRFCSKKCYWEWLPATRSGENNYFWEGGKSFEPYPVTFNATFKRKIRERDGYKCVLCGQYGKDVHHIDYNKEKTTPDNCITLCRSCHGKTNVNRDHWQKLLSSKIAVVYKGTPEELMKFLMLGEKVG